MNGIQLNYDKSRTDEITVTLPTSKSMAARALIIGALAGKGPDEIKNLPDCTDTRELSAAINSLLAVSSRPGERIEMENPSPLTLHLNLGLGGTSLRFFTALAASLPAVETEIDCAAPLKKRPLAPLCEALNRAGADIRYMETPGYPPLFVKGDHVPGGNREISAEISSQFVSAMIMTAPFWRDGLNLTLTGEKAVSFPYIDMTVGMMKRAGADVTVDRNEKKISVAPIPYNPESISRLSPEADWSAASYFYELALILPDRAVRISSLTPPAESLQGDSGCEAIFSKLGVETEYLPEGGAILRCDRAKRDAIAEASKKEPVRLDMSEMPDLVPALAVALCMAGIRFEIYGIGHLRHKESDRISAIQLEMEKIGFGLRSTSDTLSWSGDRVPTGENETIETYHDHRIAMAFAPAAALLPYLSIRDPKVTEKSFPEYFGVLKEAGFQIKPF